MKLWYTKFVADVIDNQFYEADCYIRGTNLVAKYNYWNGDKSEYTYYTQNAHGDVVNLTDKDGKVTKSYRYDAFGVEKDIDDSDTNAFRYCGEYYDKETATVYLRARNYNPSTGRFTQRDSFAGKLDDPLSLNLYTYCANNPVYYSDPSGHFFGGSIALSTALNIAKVAVGVMAVSYVLNQPQVQEDLSTMINKASYAVEEFAENTTSLLASAISTIGCGIAEFTGISSSSVLSAPTGLMSNFSTTVDSNYNPYLAPWLYASMGSQSIAKDDADSAEKDIDIPYFPNKNPVYFPEDPNDFNPIGMVRNEYNTPNGLVIKWGYTKKSTVFEWNEDLKNGEHYHCLLPEWKNQHSESGKDKDVIHYHAGQIVPEPWATWYRGY